MNLQCPNCQKLLTVPEQHAGQLMKCPLCRGNFTVPALPAGDGLNQTPAFAPPPPTPPVPPAGQDVYGVAHEPELAPAFQASPPTSPAPAPAFSTAAPEPAFSTGAPPAAPPVAPAPTLPPSAPPSAAVPGPSLAPAPFPRPTEGYTRTSTIWISDRVLQWVPAVALVLIFILSFFTWVSVTPGGEPLAWQGAWGAAFNSYSDDADLWGIFPYFITEAQARKDKDGEKRSKDDKKSANEVGVSLLLLFYLVPFLLVTLIVTLAVAALPFIKAPLPAQVQQLLPWRWAIVAGLNCILLLFLGLQVLLPFSIESSVKDRFDKIAKKESLDTTKEKKLFNVAQGQMLESLQRSIWMKLAVVLQILATLAAVLMYWIEKRGPAKPLPRVEIQW